MPRSGKRTASSSAPAWAVDTHLFASSIPRRPTRASAPGGGLGEGWPVTAPPTASQPGVAVDVSEKQIAFDLNQRQKRAASRAEFVLAILNPVAVKSE